MHVPHPGLFSRFFAVGVLCAASGAFADRASHDAAASDAEAADHAPADGTWTIQRVGGEPEAEVESLTRDGKTLYVAGAARVNEALPEGYPRPTPPGAIEIKKYPSVRRAEIQGEAEGDFRMMGRRTSQAFWPLFQHIKRRDIAMTAPVEMDYHGMSADGEADAWAMSFLYREPSLGETGSDGRIRVYDTEPVTVVSIGVRGRLDEAAVRDALDTLERWLGDAEAWRPAGSPRTFGYNGPMVPSWNRWWEVQLPIEPAPDAGEQPETAAPSGSASGDAQR